MFGKGTQIATEMRGKKCKHLYCRSEIKLTQALWYSHADNYSEKSNAEVKFNAKVKFKMQKWLWWPAVGPEHKALLAELQRPQEWRSCGMKSLCCPGKKYPMHTSIPPLLSKWPPVKKACLFWPRALYHAWHQTLTPTKLLISHPICNAMYHFAISHMYSVCTTVLQTRSDVPSIRPQDIS